MADPKIVRMRSRSQPPTTDDNEVVQLYPGFSSRFNHFLDLCVLEDPIPALDAGRVTYLQDLFDSNRISVSQWLNKDLPPKPTTLRKIIKTLLHSIPGEHHPMKVEAWMKYGEEAVRNPFASSKTDSLSPLAHTTINYLLHELSISPSAISFERTVKDTLHYLHSLRLTPSSSLTSEQLSIIAQIIRNNVIHS